MLTAEPQAPKTRRKLTIPLAERLEKAIWNRFPGQTLCHCRCGNDYSSEVGVGNCETLITREPCPSCGSHTNIFAHRDPNQQTNVICCQFPEKR
jgi:hypothetical protein